MDRSRSSSRDRSPRRKHRKFQRKHKSRRSRSRSRSRSRADVPSAIHFNPAFTGHSQSQMGYSASQLVQQNNMLENEVIQLKNALMAEQGAKAIEAQRNHMISQEIRNLTIQRDDAIKRCNEVVRERRMMIEMKADIVHRMGTMEVENRQLREDVDNGHRAVEHKNEEIRAFHYQSEIVQQQIAALNDRNTALKQKCETMVATNRRQQDEIDAKQKFAENARLNVKRAEADLQCANLEIKRLLRELENAQQLESTSQDDKRSIEAILRRKEDEIRVAQYKSASALKTANDTIEKLENRLKNEQSTANNDLAVFQEAIYVAIETMKATYEKQLSRLEDEVEAMKKARMQEEREQQEEEQSVQKEQMEELPEYLQTPHRPDPMKMHEMKNTNQVKIDIERELLRTTRASSGPPVDAPVAWMHRKLEFGDDEKSDTATQSTSGIRIETAPTLSEEELLLGEPLEMTSPIHNLDLIEEQLLDEI